MQGVPNSPEVLQEKLIRNRLAVVAKPFSHVYEMWRSEHACGYNGHLLDISRDTNVIRTGCVSLRSQHRLGECARGALAFCPSDMDHGQLRRVHR
jgi:hypothetical protein